ncbi:MAG: M48 family metallopeptidase [Sphingobacteriaceae bacterium]
MAWALLFLYDYNKSNEFNPFSVTQVHIDFLTIFPLIMLGVGLWFIVAFFLHSRLIMRATGSKPLERMEHKRVYNLVENLCIAEGMTKMPRVFVIEDSSLNAFASGIDSGTYAVSLSRGIIDKLNDEELQAVIAHELTHIRNRDTRLLVVSIIFVGIFAFISEMVFKTIRYKKEGGKGEGIWFVGAIGLTTLAYVVSMLIQFAISRKREYMADAGAVEMTKNPAALASALRKIADDSQIEAVERKDVAQLFIENPQGKPNWLEHMFATHPPIGERIGYLEQL